MQIRPHVSLYSVTGRYIRSIRAQEARIMLLEGVATQYNGGGKIRAIQLIACLGAPNGRPSNRPDQSYTWMEPVRGQDGNINGYIHSHKMWRFKKEYELLYRQVQLDCLVEA